MNHEIEIGFDTAMDQAGKTAHDYFLKSRSILDSFELPYSCSDVIALAHIMAIDYNSCLMGIKMQEIRDALESLDYLGELKVLRVSVDTSE